MSSLSGPSVALSITGRAAGDIGVGTPRPKLSWSFGEAQDWYQASYRLSCQRRDGSIETSERSTDASVAVDWPFKPLISRESVKLSLTVTGTDGFCSTSPTLTVEAALLNRDDWMAQMISGPVTPPNTTKRPFRVRTGFRVPENFSSARLYVTAFGIYEAELNGRVVGDQVLAPGWQSYKHRLNYQTHDVTEYLRAGALNVLGGYIGEGWYAGRLGRPGQREIFGTRLGFMAQLEVDSVVVAQTDAQWEVLDGPVISSELYDGEVIDTRLADKGWCTAAGLGLESRVTAEIIEGPEGELYSPNAPPERRLEEVSVKSIIQTPSGKTVLDFGQNLVGWIRINSDIVGEDGQKVVIRHAEVLEHGELGTRPLRTAKATNTIVLGGSTVDLEPRFTFFGFRYAEVEGFPGHISSEDFTAVVVGADMPRTGYFRCSHSMINQLHSNVVWSMKGNFLSVPTDCPQRDERLGWTGDLQVFAPTANFLYDTSGFLSDWLLDVRSETLQYKGVPPVVVPNIRGDPEPHAVWADLVILTPWDLYKAFGDESILTANYDAMLAWLERGLPRDPSGSGLWNPDAVQYADWLDPTAPPQYPANGKTDTHLVANAYLVYVTGKAEEIARIVGRADDASRLGAEHARLRSTFRKEYVTPNGRLASDSQTAYALALQFGLLEDEEVANAAKRLAWLVRYDTFKIATGFAGTPLILDALAGNGALSTAYRMLQEKENPSWLYPVGMGATTIWERWDSMLPDGTINPGQMTSFNHYALGAVAAFLHGTVGGICATSPGWKTFSVDPRPGGTITSAEVRLLSPYGQIECSWSVQSGKLQIDLLVPPNSTAEFTTSDGFKKLGSGRHTLEVRWQEDSTWPPKGIKSPGSFPIRDEYVP